MCVAAVLEMKLLLVISILALATADWDTWLKQGADNLAQEIGFDSADAMKLAAVDTFNSMNTYVPKGKDPLSAGYGAAEPQGEDFKGDDPYRTMYGCAPNHNEGRKMCWTTDYPFASHMWCWQDYTCVQHDDCVNRRKWMACHGDPMEKGTNREAYNKQKLGSRYSATGL